MAKHTLPPISPRDFLAKEPPPHLVAHAETPPGKMILLTVFILCELQLGSLVMPIIISAIALTSFVPRYRWHIMALGTFVLFLISPFWFDPELPMHVAVQEDVINAINFTLLGYGTGLFFFLFAYAVLAGKRRFTHKFPFKRPIASLLVFYFILVICADQHILHGVPQVLLWSLITTFGGYIWYLGYALLDYKENAISLPLQLGSFHPVWGLSPLPFGRGVANMRRLEATNSQELAIAQINGVKLIFECCILQFIAIVLEHSVHSYLGVPTLRDAFAHQISGAFYPSYACWFSLIVSFFESILRIAIIGNTFIACARMTGFQLLKNTDKPWQSKTVAEFWNRYYFYFKELLVHFFFYPTFLRCFKHHRRARTIFATFMAAGTGNIIYHFIKDIGWVFDLGLWGAMQQFQAYSFYCLLLSSGIAVSQLRTRRPIHRGIFRKTIIPSFTIVAFFCFIYIFADMEGQHTLPQCFTFLFHLFGLA